MQTPAHGSPACIGSRLASEEPRSLATTTICKTRSICVRSSIDSLPSDTLHCRSFINASFRSMSSDNCFCVGGLCCPITRGSTERASDSRIPTNLRTRSGFSSPNLLKAETHRLFWRSRINMLAAVTSYLEFWTYRWFRSRDRGLWCQTDWPGLRMLLTAWPRHLATDIILGNCSLLCYVTDLAAMN